MLFKNLMEWDEKLTDRLRITDTASKFKLAGSFLAHSGDSWFILLALLIVWLLTTGSWHRLAALMAVGAVALAAIVLVIKFSFRRRRPEGQWGAIYRNTDPHSFPSGHAARTALLTVLAFGFTPLWLAILIAVWALLVSLARVWMGVHYLSDIIAGIVLGALAGVIILELSPWLFSTFPMIF